MARRAQWRWGLLAAALMLCPLPVHALQPPHDASNGIGCAACHAMHRSGGMMGGGLVPRGAAQESLCKSCHNPTGKAASMSDVSNHVVDGGRIIDCGSCHDAHGPMTATDPHPGGLTRPNLRLIRPNVAKYVGPSALEPALFQSRPAHFAFDDADPPWNGVCQSCHTNTDHHRNNNSGGDHHHQAGSSCTACHPHDEGFAPEGGCSDCHNQPRGSRRQIVGAGGDFAKASHHAGGSIQDGDCTACHYLGTHGSGTVKLIDPDLGAAQVYSFDAGNPAGIENFCVNCHDADGAAAGGGTQPFSNGAAVPNVKGAAGNAWADSAHNLRAYAQNGGSPVSCFGNGTTSGCHGNGHGSDNAKLLSAAAGVSIDQFCFNCHTSGMVANNAISGPGLADDIEQSFGVGSANKHDLGAPFTVGSATFTLQCTTCHNPHVASGRYWEADLDVSPITRPDFSDPTGNPRAMGTTLWGDGTGEKMDDYGGTYRTPNGETFTGAQLPNYNRFCLDCHDPMPDPRNQAGAHGQIAFDSDPHGLNSANSPNGGGTCPDWYGCGKGEGWDGDDCIADDATCWPVMPRGRGDQLFSRGPYDHEDRIGGANFALSCTNCHEAHGSTVSSLIRTNPNGGSGTTIWNTMCDNCHYYYSDWHAGMSCGNASCHVSDGSDRMAYTGTNTLHRMGSRYGSGSTRTFDPTLVVDMRFENNLNDSGTWRLHGTWRVTAGSYAAGSSGTAAVLNDNPIEVGTRNSYWSTDEGRHGTWKYTEMKYNMTLEAWVKPTADTGTERRILAKHTYSTGGYTLELVKIGGTWRAALLTNVNGGDDPFRSSDCNGLRGAFSRVAVPLNLWSHVAATYDAAGPDRSVSDGSIGRARIYVNGEDVTDSYPDPSQCWSQPGAGEDAMFPHSDWNDIDPAKMCYNGSWCASALSVGGVNWSAPDDNFIGQLDSVKVWNVTKPASPYFESVDSATWPRVTIVTGNVGAMQLEVLFSEEAYAAPGMTGALEPADFVLDGGGPAVSGVTHVPGARTASLQLTAPLDPAYPNTLALAANAAYDEYGNAAATVEAVVIVLSGTCPAGPTSFQLNEAAGSSQVLDAYGVLLGVVSDPAAALLGDGYLTGDGVDNYVDFPFNPSCLQASTDLVLETRIRPTGLAGTDSYIKRIFARDGGGNYQLSAWRNNGWGAGYNAPSGTASIALWVRVADTHGGQTWKPVLTDYATCPIVSDHWYLVRAAWNSAKTGGTPGQFFVPADIYVTDQGTDGAGSGATWAGERNCTNAAQSYHLDTQKLYTGDRISPADGEFTIGANVNNHANNVFQGLIDWISVDTSGGGGGGAGASASGRAPVVVGGSFLAAHAPPSPPATPSPTPLAGRSPAADSAPAPGGHSIATDGTALVIVTTPTPTPTATPVPSPGLQP